MRKLISLFMAAALLVNMFAFCSFAAGDSAEEKELYNIEISGTADYETSYKLFDRINNYRTVNRLDTFTADKELMDAAMQRAAECAVYLGSARPNDTENKNSYESVMPEKFKNGTYQYASAFVNSLEEIFGEENEMFYNFLKSDYKSVGVGIVYHNGIYFFVILASNIEGTPEETRTVKKDTGNFNILCEKKLVEKIVTEPEALTIEKGKSDSVFFECVNAGWTSVKFIINPKSFTLSDEKTLSAELMTNAVKLTGLETGSCEVATSITSVDGKGTVSGKVKVTVTPPAAKKLLGDVTADGNITVVDAKWMLQILAGTKTMTNEMTYVIDMNNDGKLSTVDAKYVLQIVSGMKEPVEV